MAKAMVIAGVVALILLNVAAVYAAPPSDRFITALIRVESTNNDFKVGDKTYAYGEKKGQPRPESEWSYGPLQISQQVCDDVNRRYKTSYRAVDLLGERALSIKICGLYFKMYATERKIGRAPTDEDRARIWNGGPNGWRNNSLTNAHWIKVKRELKKLEKKPVASH